MFCPNCGQEQISNETRFCSRCGLLLTEIANIVFNNGILSPNQNEKSTDSPRKRGVKHGIFFILVALMLLPLIIGFSVLVNIPPPLSIIYTFITVGAGILRIVYALMFESGNQKTEIEGKSSNLFSPRKNQQSLPAQQSNPVSNYNPPKQGNWRDTNDLQPLVDTEKTTKYFENDLSKY